MGGGVGSASAGVGSASTPVSVVPSGVAAGSVSDVAGEAMGEGAALVLAAADACRPSKSTTALTNGTAFIPDACMAQSITQKVPYASDGGNRWSPGPNIGAWRAQIGLSPGLRACIITAMLLRWTQTQILVFAVLLLGAGCGADARFVPNSATGVDARPGQIPDGELPAPDAELAPPDSPPAIPDAQAVSDALPPDTTARIPDSGVRAEGDAALSDAAQPDAGPADAESPDADSSDTAGYDNELNRPDAHGLASGGGPATVVLLPDTQYYSAFHPDIFPSQTRWIVEQNRARKISMVLHVGDLVDVYDDQRQWQVASSAMHALDGLIPYTVTTGNHDTDVDRSCPISESFAPAGMPWISGVMEGDKIENNYVLVDIGATHWLVLTLEYGPRDVVMTWADGVLKAFPDRPAIIVTHAYLYSDGNRYDLAVSGLDNSQPNFQWFIPQVYNYTGDQGINDGEDIWQKLVVPNRNVRLVFSGHANGAARLTSSRSDGTLVHQVLSDYQGLYSGTADDLGGSGYLRIMEFDDRRKSIRVQTYSPYLDSYLTDDANQFTLSLEM